MQLAVRYLSTNGVEHLVTAGQAAGVAFEHCLPARSIPSWAGQKHTPGWYWSATTGDMVAYESFLESKWLRMLDFAADTVALASQPFEFAGRDGDGSWWHVPDLFVRRADGTVLIVDVKDPRRLQHPRVVKQAGRSAAACARIGWDYRMVGAPDPQLAANLAWLSGYRRPPGAGQQLVEQILALAERPITIAEATGFQHFPELARTVVFHLLWHQRLACDLSRPLRDTTVIRLADDTDPIAAHTVMNKAQPAPALPPEPAPTSVTKAPRRTGRRMTDRFRLAVGDWIDFDDERYQVVGLTGNGVRLRSEAGRPQIILTSALLTDTTFRAATEPPTRTAAGPVLDPDAMLASLPEPARTKALELQGHLFELTCGFRSGDALRPADGEPRPPYDPNQPLTARVRAKAAELGLGERTVWGLLDKWRDAGLWGLADKRKGQPVNPLRNIDPRVIQAVRDQAAAERLDSSATIGNRFRRRTQNRLDADYGPGVVELPKKDTFRRTVDVLLDRRPSDPAYQRASAANRPDRTFGNVTATRPGEVVMIDTTPLDVLAYDPATDSVGSLELTVALDLATRSILGWRFTPDTAGTKAIDIGLVLADAITPEPMRPGWAEALRYAAMRVPFDRILDLDARFAEAAARPVIYPETLLFDHGKPYQSDVVFGFCRSQRIDVQDARKLKPTDKPQIERLFKTINGQFTEHVAGYKGFNVAHRGRHVEGDALWTIDEIAEFFAEYVVAVYQRHNHTGLVLQGFANLNTSPNDAYAAALASAGFVDCPNNPNLYFELLPMEFRKIHPYGIEWNYLIYNGDGLYPYRNTASPYPGGKWPIRKDPRNELHAYFQDPADGRWHLLRWTHALDEHQPFTDVTRREAQRLIAARGIARDDQAAVAEALLDLQNRTDNPKSWTKTDRTRWVRDAHRARAHAEDVDRAAPPVTGAFGLPHPATAPEADDEFDGDIDLAAIPAADIWNPHQQGTRTS